MNFKLISPHFIIMARKETNKEREERISLIGWGEFLVQLDIKIHGKA